MVSRRVNKRALTSATAVDWPLDPDVLTQAVQRTGETGVDYVKLGLLPGNELLKCIEALANTASEYRLVAVFFADRGVFQAEIPAIQETPPDREERDASI